jgi:hypothetical protein
MKKYLLLISLMLSGVCYSQSFNKVYCATPYLYQYGEWVKGESNYPERMYVIIDGYNIKVTNQAESKYVTYGSPTNKTTSEYESYTWDAYDKNGTQCIFIIKKYFGYERKIMTFIVDKFAIEYIVDTSK